MNERLFLRFEQSGQSMAVNSFTLDEGITFEEPRDASPLNVGVGLQSLQPVRLAAVQARHGWNGNQFGFDARLSEGGIVLSGFEGDRAGLPPGPYDITVEVESYVFKNAQPRIFIREGAQTSIVLEVKPDTRRIELSDNFDKHTAALVDASIVDGKNAMNWLAGTVRPAPRVQRRVCALNILSRLAAPPMPKVAKGLTPQFTGIHFADVDRIYATADPMLNDLLKSFVKADAWEGAGHLGIRSTNVSSRTLSDGFLS